MKKIVPITICLFLCTGIFAQPSPQAKTPGQVAASAYIPYAGTILSSGTYGLFPAEMQQIYLTAVTYAWMTPSFITAPEKAVPQAGAALAFESAGLLMAGHADWNVPVSLSDAFWNIGWKLNYWTMYEGYAKTRSLYPETNEGFHSVSFKDALKAPFSWDVLSRKEVAYPLIGLLAGGTLFEILGGTDNAVWNTGKAYIGQKEVPVALGIAYNAAVSTASYLFTGIGEEALFRGVGYEEMKRSLGRVPAALIDSLLFSAVHVPQELLAGMDAPTALGNYLLRSAVAAGLQLVYEQSGLESSIAVHVWEDIICSMLLYLFQGGVPETTAPTANIAPTNGRVNTAVNACMGTAPTFSIKFTW